MRTLLITLVLIGGFLLTGCSHDRERFLLTATLSPAQHPPSRITIELRNVSGRAQQIRTLTNLFEGSVYLRDAKGWAHQFTQTNFFIMMMSAEWITPTLELADGSSFRFEHSLSEFIDHQRHFPSAGGGPPSFPTLDREFLPGCEIWCCFNIIQRKQLKNRYWTGEQKETLVSPTLKYSQ